jgi:uncharacterized protein (TIGR02266 family)
MTDRTLAKRKWPRLHHELIVAISSERHGKFSGWSTSISQGGCFVNTNLAPPVDDVVQVLLQLPGEAEECKLQARVVWSQPAGPGVDEPGMGLEFLDADDATRGRLGRIVAQLSKDLAITTSR